MSGGVLCVFGVAWLLFFFVIFRVQSSSFPEIFHRHSQLFRFLARTLQTCV